MESSIFKDLNQKQIEAVKTTEGPVLILVPHHSLLRNGLRPVIAMRQVSGLRRKS